MNAGAMLALHGAVCDHIPGDKEVFGDAGTDQLNG